MNERNRRFLSALPMLIVMIVIFCFSAQPSIQSNASSDYVVHQLIETIENVQQTLGIDVNESLVATKNVQHLTFIVRKLAHTFEYAILGICICIFLYQKKAPRKKMCLLAIGIGFVYACTDEFHQWFVPGRSCEFRDVLIDTNGVFLGLLVVLFALHRCKERKEKGC